MNDRIINGVNVNDDTAITCVPNPKREGCAAWERYNGYESAVTVGEYLKVNAGKHALPDLRWDHEKGFVEFMIEE